jgi:1,4-alpha-glucan branching enzyme
VTAQARRARSPGRLAIVLHTHMPYVEGVGSPWPFGEEWLWEAIATSYLPLLALLSRGAPLTLSLTPVLCDQLEAPGALDRCRAFLAGVRPESHRLDAAELRARGDEAAARELERAAGDYARALESMPEDLLGALRPFAAWTSAATHAVLPLLATDAGVRLQVRTGVASHRARFGGWAGGFWLPECAYAPWLDPLLEEAGVHAVCVDFTDVLGFGDPRHLQPVATAGGPLLVPVDRATVELVWSDGGYPAHGAYRDYHRRSARDHHPWANDGAVYAPERAAAQARADASDFVTRVRDRVAGGGLAVCALDTELLGHWWYEGPVWLAAVLDAAARDGLQIVALDDALGGVAPAPPLELPAEPASALPPDRATSWGTPRDLSTWSGPAVADLAWAARRAELRVAAAGAAAPDRALRELLALQSSDWAFLADRALAGEYPRRRAAAHAAALDAAVAGRADGAGDAVGNLAPHLCRAAFLEP